MVKTLPANAGDVRDADSTPGSGKFPGGGNGDVKDADSTPGSGKFPGGGNGTPL